MDVKDLSDKAFTLQPPEILALRKKIEKIGIPLKEWDISIYRGIVTGFNDAFIMNNETKQSLCKQDLKSAEIIKPILRGKDIKAYEKKWAKLWGIATFPTLKINIEDYPVVKNYLLTFGRDRLEQGGRKLPDGTKSRKKTRNEWFETQDQIGYCAEFEKEKIVYPCIMSDKSRFCYDNDKTHPLAPANIITGDEIKFLLPILNSSFIYFLFRKFYMGGGIEGELKTNNLEQLPVPQILKYEQQPFIELADKIIQNKKDGKDTILFEKQIDQLVYQLYDLTDEEIAIVEKASD